MLQLVQARHAPGDGCHVGHFDRSAIGQLGSSVNLATRWYQSRSISDSIRR
jgi:hypothetical protein